MNIDDLNRDMSERLRVEEQFAYVQKMDDIGQLAEGISHNFNNILTGFIGAG